MQHTVLPLLLPNMKGSHTHIMSIYNFNPCPNNYPPYEVASIWTTSSKLNKLSPEFEQHDIIIMKWRTLFQWIKRT